MPRSTNPKPRRGYPSGDRLAWLGQGGDGRQAAGFIYSVVFIPTVAVVRSWAKSGSLLPSSNRPVQQLPFAQKLLAFRCQLAAVSAKTQFVRDVHLLFLLFLLLSQFF